MVAEGTDPLVVGNVNARREVAGEVLVGRDSRCVLCTNAQESFGTDK